MKRVLVFLILFFSGIAINAQVLQALEAPKPIHPLKGNLLARTLPETTVLVATQVPL